MFNLKNDYFSFLGFFYILVFLCLWYILNSIWFDNYEMINFVKIIFDLIVFCCYGIMIFLMIESDIFEIM